MPAYEERTYDSIEDIKRTPAVFWVCVRGNEPIGRNEGNNYTDAKVYRNGDDLLFNPRRDNRTGRCVAYVIPVDEYRSVDGDPNVNLSAMTRVEELAYTAIGNLRKETEWLEDYAKRIGKAPLEAARDVIEFRKGLHGGHDHYDGFVALYDTTAWKKWDMPAELDWPTFENALVTGLDAPNTYSERRKALMDAKSASTKPLGEKKPSEMTIREKMEAGLSEKRVARDTRSIWEAKGIPDPTISVKMAHTEAPEVENGPKTEPDTVLKATETKSEPVFAPFEAKVVQMPKNGTPNAKNVSKTPVGRFGKAAETSGTPKRRRKSCVVRPDDVLSAEGCLAIGAYLLKAKRKAREAEDLRLHATGYQMALAF